MHSYRSITKLINSLGLEETVIFKGYVPENDLSGFYKRAKALIFPSFFGPTNIPPLDLFQQTAYLWFQISME